MMEPTGLVPPQALAKSAFPGGARGKISAERESGGTGGDKDGGFLSSVRGKLDENQHPKTSEKSLTTLGHPPDDATGIASGLPQRPRGSVLNVGNPLDVHPPEELLYEIEFSKEPDHERAQIGRLKAEVSKSLPFRGVQLDF